MTKERINKQKLLCTVLLSAAVHAYLLYFIHLSPIHSSFVWDTALSQSFYEHTYEKFLKEQRTLELGKIFSQLEPTTQTRKEELLDLSFEFSPRPLITFPEGEPLLLDGEEFSLANTKIELPSSPFEGIHIEEGSSLISSTPYLISNELPHASVQMINYDDASNVELDGDAFDIHVEYTHKKERPGFVFKLTLTPKAAPRFARLPQTFYFLIDRSNSIPRGRFILNKQIVATALGHLKPGDHFNILLFDDRVVKLSEDSLQWNQESVLKAREFLEKQQHGGYFAVTDLYTTLGKVLPRNVEADHMHTAILLSDGDTYLPLEKQRQTIGHWTLQNGGKIALYTATTGGGNNLPLLELISVFNKGMLLYSPDPEKMEERFIELIKMIRNPIAKEMSLTAISSDPQMSIRLQPKEHHLPHLYLNRPYVIYGSTNRLSDFVLFLQGESKGHPIDLKKQISFKRALSSSPDLEKRWVQLIAYEHYHNFLKEGNLKHLDIAKRLLQPYKLPMPLKEDVHHKR